MTGVTSYTSFVGQDGIAPVAVAIDHMGTTDASGIVTPDYPWLNRANVVAILFGYSSVILVMLMGQSRVFFSMSKDGLIPKIFSSINTKTQNPAKSNLLFMIFVSSFAAFVPARVVGEMTSIGTLFAFILVCAGIWVMRVKMPDLPRAFKTPLVPLVPILGIATCLFMMVFLPMDTWIRLIVWMLIGMDIYLVYGAKNSHLGNGTDNRKGMKIARITGLLLCFLLAIVGFLHQKTVGFDTDKTLLYVSLIFAAVHLFVYARKLGRAEA
jgi:APA family basic amino acid/polyamine antiporter